MLLKLDHQLLGKPSAWVPIVLSLLALVLVLVSLTLFGIPAKPPQDEGTLAHLWQLLMVTQGFFVVYFMIRYLPEEPKKSLTIFLLQLVAAFLACSPVFLLRL